jgi:hypothetical protein
MTDDRIDFSTLDPTRDGERFDGIVRSVVQAAAPELAARRAGAGVFGQVAGWWRPLLAAAAIAGVGSAAALTQVERPASIAGTTYSVEEAIGVPQQIAQWVWTDETPTPAELLTALETER